MGNVELQELNTSKQDWALEFIANADRVSSFIFPATISVKSLSEYIAGLSNMNGGYILVGASCESGICSGFETVSPEIIKETGKLLVNAAYTFEAHSARFQNIYLLKVSKSDSIAFSDGKAFVIKEGKPVLMSEETLLNQLGLGLNSELLNMLSKQIIDQSCKIDVQSKHIHTLTHDLKEKEKLKNQLPGLIVGGVIGAIIGWFFSIGLDKLFGIS